MTTIQSGSSRQRIWRTALLTLLVIGFGAAYLWDGFHGYPERNRKDFVRLLNLTPASGSLVIDPKLTAEEAARRSQVIGRDRLDTVDRISSAFGKPTIVVDKDIYYLGPAGHLRINLGTAGQAPPEWVKAGKSETDIRLQRWIGFGLLALGIVFVIQLFRVVGFRVVLSQDGLRIGNSPPIPLSAITSINADDFRKTGRVDIHYQKNDRHELLRLDDYQVKELPVIIAAVCKGCGIVNPLPAN